MAWELVGRDDQLAAAQASLETSDFLVLAGPTGVGKSRLLSEIAGQYESAKRPVFRAFASAATSTVPLAPFVGLIPTPPPADPSLLMTAILQRVRSLDRHHDLLIAVDDAHRLDAASLALLTLLASGTSARILITVREDAPRPVALSEFMRGAGGSRIDVPALTRGDVGHLTEAVLGDVEPSLRDELWRLSQGNPLMLRELFVTAAARLDTGDGRSWSEGGSLVDRRLGSLAKDRLAGLGRELTDALHVITLGAPVPYDLLMAAIPSRSVDALVDLDLVELEGSGPACSVRPAHPLYDEVLRESLGPQRQRELAALLVSAAKSSGTDVDPVRTALWQQMSGDLGDPGIALEGVQSALARMDGELALQLLEPFVDTLDVGLRALLHGSALMQSRRFTEAENVFASGQASGVAVEHAVPLASARSFNLAFGLRQPAAADEVLRAAVLTSPDPVAAARLESERGVVAGIAGDFTLAADSARRAINLESADDPTLASAYVSLTLAQALRGRFSGFEDLVVKGLAYAERASEASPFARDQLLVTWAHVHFGGGRLDAAMSLGEEALDDPDRSLLHWLWSSTMSIIALAQGRLEEAVELAAEGHRHMALAETLDLGRMTLGMTAAASGHAGVGSGLEELEDVRRATDDARNGVWLDRGRAWLHVARGEVGSGVAIARQGGLAALEHDHAAWGMVLLHDGVRMAMSAAEAAPLAEDLSTALTATTHAHLLETMTEHAVQLAAGNAAGLLQVAKRFADFGAYLYAAEASAQAALVMEASADSVATARAATLSHAWQLRCPGARTPALRQRPSAEVSARMVQIAVAAAEGATSPEIAENLYLSVRTVNNHLGAMYRTLELSGRADLTAVLAPVLGPAGVGMPG